MTDPRGSVWGIDPSVDHPAFAEWPSGRTWRLSIGGEGAERMGKLLDAVMDFAVGLDEPTAIFIESPIGRVPSPELVRAAGVIEAALAVSAIVPAQMIVRLSPPRWKSLAGLPGNCNKAAVAEKFPAPSQDESDALGIAAAGWSLLRVESEEAAA